MFTQAKAGLFTDHRVVMCLIEPLLPLIKGCLHSDKIIQNEPKFTLIISFARCYDLKKPLLMVLGSNKNIRLHVTQARSELFSLHSS